MLEKRCLPTGAAILLVSIDYLTSDYIQNVHIPALLELKAKRGLKIFPLIIEPCAWEMYDWLSKMTVFPNNGTPLSVLEPYRQAPELDAFIDEVASLFSFETIYDTREIAQKINALLKNWKNEALEPKQKALKLLGSLGLYELKKDFETIYIHALLEFAVEAEPVELTLLFGEKKIKIAIQRDLYTTRRKEFEKMVDEVLVSGKIPAVSKIYETAADLIPWVMTFQRYLEYLSRQSSDTFSLSQYNQWRLSMYRASPPYLEGLQKE
ncbi:MAG: hypothetical protein GY757_19310, partial [bacterium]|nr:hypothetical protein [bacterium]